MRKLVTTGVLAAGIIAATATPAFAADKKDHKKSAEEYINIIEEEQSVENVVQNCGDQLIIAIDSTVIQCNIVVAEG